MLSSVHSHGGYFGYLFTISGQFTTHQSNLPGFILTKQLAESRFACLLRAAASAAEIQAVGIIMVDAPTPCKQNGITPRRASCSKQANSSHLGGSGATVATSNQLSSWRIRNNSGTPVTKQSLLAHINMWTCLASNVSKPPQGHTSLPTIAVFNASAKKHKHDLLSRAGRRAASAYAGYRQFLKKMRTPHLILFY